MTELAIDARGLRKEFGEKVAVADLTLQVPRGEVFGFLGPNGAGKTTSVKMLLGLTKPTAGVATLLDRPLGDRATRAKIGFLPEHFRFHEWLQAAEFLDLHGRLYRMSAAKRATVIPDLLELVGLGHRSQTRLSAFSKGMLQRIGLAQALLNDPELVFLDEPTSGLDPLGRRLVRDIINGLRAEGTAVFLNSHLLSEIELTCDRVAFIREGTIVRVASLQELQQENIRITLRVGQPTEALLAGLAHFGNGAQLEKANGRIQLTLADESQIPQLVNWLVSQGHSLYELSPQRLSLEDQFLQIVGDQMYDA
ncbi:MAG: ABC transporter ATP-binding protein [Chloroflexi bacterium]|nr:ABC transporter ATP-binding protein [Chloroflexota bacterium]MCI0577734.1 ABC transporter ATP-binding protein [Chloroflexota bacterium]MCI0644004.1 ABC transporter ATP-binding protein [Chloroflexota bacterium]MCI0731997.1 ABC transporter ATP-binding protein [Chloroflexota bacterium]